MQRPKRMLLQCLLRAPVRRQDRRQLRHEARVWVRVQVQYPEGMLFRLDERVPMRYQIMGPE